MCHRTRVETNCSLITSNSSSSKRRSGQSVTASDFGSNGPRFESGRGRCVESLDKALYSQEAFTLASISYLAILVKYILAKKKKKKKRKTNIRTLPYTRQESCV